MMVYLGLGSNLGDRAEQLAEAVRRLAAAGLEPRAVSPVYETEPQGRRDQAWFLNCVLAADTELSARGVLEAALSVESAMGRQRLVHWGPRVIDVDVLLYGDERIREPDLVVPHPRLHERAFALVPLVDIAPEIVIPGLAPAAALAERCREEAGQSVRRWGSLPGLSMPVPPVGSTRSRLLERLRAAGETAVSGAALAQDLHITRSAVWKQVKRLRAEGHAILGTAGAGYRLEAASSDLDPLSSADLVSAQRREVGRVLHVLSSVDSTNRFARQLGLDGTPSGTVVAAERQSAGRGRNGRTFVSPPGGVYLSVVVRPQVPPPHAGRLTLMTAVAVCEAIEQVSSCHPLIKWPNDVLLGGEKVCGILLEMVAQEDCVDFVVLGAGINVRSAPDGVGATSLWEQGARVGRAEVAGAVLDRLDTAYAAFLAGRWTELLSQWRRRCSTLGQLVRVTCGDGQQIVGRAVDVTLEGALLVDAPEGVRTVYAGDVTHVRPEHAASTVSTPGR